jgi:hypothetical protein
MPYVQSSLDRFLGGYRGRGDIRIDELCRTEKGRTAELVRFGCLSGEARFRVALTCRHHACEMMASYVLEGIVEAALDATEAGAWLCDHVEFLAVPFVDKDGVEDGDQGKRRHGHDHSQDYSGESRYATVRAIKERLARWVAGTPSVGLDLHCPGPRGSFHEIIMSPSRLRDLDNWARARPFLGTLEASQIGPLRFDLAESEAFTGWAGTPVDTSAPPRSFTGWLRSLPGVSFAITFEVPYANAGGREVNQDTARAWGRDLCVALGAHLRAAGAANA